MNDELVKTEASRSPEDIASKVADFYEQHGLAFARTRGFVWNEEKIIVERVQPGMTVVDVGAGNGRFARLINPTEVTYLGFEPSSTLRASAPPSLDIRPGGLPQIDIDDNTADLTVCLAVLHHLPTISHRQSALKELIRITKPGGLIAATVWHLDQNGDVWIPWKAEGANAKRYVYGFSVEEWKNLWDQPELILEQLSEGKNLFILARKK